MRTIRLKFRRSIIKRMKISVKNSQKRRSYVTLFLFAWMAHIAGAQGFTAGALTAFLYLAGIGAYDVFFLVLPLAVVFTVLCGLVQIWLF